MATKEALVQWPEAILRHEPNIAKLRQFEQQVRSGSAAPDRAMQFSEPAPQTPDPAPQVAPARNTKQKSKAKAP